MLTLHLYFSGEEAAKFTEMLNANKARPIEVKTYYEEVNKRTRFSIECKSEREIFNLGFLWKSKIQPYEEAAPF